MMNEISLPELTAADAALLELGLALGQAHTFGLVAGRCSAAQAQGIRRLREEKLYKRLAETWLEFCPQYLKISRTEADRTIRLLEEFGPAYFELSQLTRVSPETFRAIAPAIRDGALHFNGEVIALNSANAHKVAAAVAELRNALPKKSVIPELRSLTREIQALGHELDLEQRIVKLDQYCTAIVAEFEKISRDEGLGLARRLFHSALARVREELERVALESESS
jgi:hypothetical protein